MEFFKQEKIQNLLAKLELNHDFVHKKSFKIFLAVIITFLLLLIFIPFLFDNSALKFKVEQKVSEVLKANLEIKGDIHVAIFPIPTISANDVFLKNYNLREKNYNFYAKNVKIRAGFFSFLLGEFKAKKIIIYDGILQNYFNKNNANPRDDLFTQAFEKYGKTNKISGNSGISGKFFDIEDIEFSRFSSQNSPTVIIKNSEIISYDINSFKSEINKINSNIYFTKKKISGSGNFVNQDILNEFEIKARFDSEVGQNNSYVKLSTPFGIFKITGAFTSPNNGLLTSNFIGDFQGEIIDLKSFYKSYISPDGLIYNKINPNSDSIKISANILNTTEEIRVSDLVINSSYINGNGYAIIDVLRSVPTLDIDLNLDNIDLDAIWLIDKTVANNEEKPQDIKAMEADLNLQQQNNDQNLTINLTKDFRNFDVDAEIKIDKIEYLDEEIKNLNLYMTVSKMGQLLILPLTLELPDKGLVRMNGVIENNGQVKFIGKIYVDGQNLNEVFKWLKIESQNLKYDNLKDYLFYSDIMITPHYTRLNDIYFNINNDETELLGEAKIDYGSKTSNIISSFEITKFNFDNYFLTSNQNAYLSVGQLLKKLLWLNNITSNNEISLKFNNLTYGNLNFNDQTVKLRFGQGYFEITELKLNSPDFDLSALLAVDISREQPRLDISLTSNNFSFISKQNNAEGKINAIDQFFALPSLEGFNGSLLFAIKNAKIDNLDLKNIAIEGKYKDGIIDFSKFSSDLYNGSLEYKGSLGIKFDKTFSGNLNFNNVALKPLLSDLFNLKTIDGTANITSSITSNASKKEDFKKNLSSEIKISASGIGIDEYGLNDLIKKMFNAKNYKNELANPDKILFNELAKTVLKQATGSVSISKNDGGQFKFDFEALAVNGILSGKFNINENSIDALANIIFLSGNRSKQTPINIATSIKGPLDALMQSTNLDQVKQYLGLKSSNNSENTITISPSNEIAPNDNIKIDPASQKQVDANLKTIDNMNQAVMDAALKAKEQLQQNQQQENAK